MDLNLIIGILVFLLFLIATLQSTKEASLFTFRVWCYKCKSEHEDSPFKIENWAVNFFLGKRCQHCGEYKPWYKSYGRWVRDIEFKRLKPSSWFSGYSWQEKEGRRLNDYFDG